MMRYLLLPALLSLPLAGCGPFAVNTVAVSPDGRIAFCVAPDTGYSIFIAPVPTDVVVTDAEGKTLERLTSGARHRSWATFSPDGKVLLYLECEAMEDDRRPPTFAPALVMHEMSTGRKAVLRTDSDIDFLLFPRFSPDGRLIAYLTMKHLKVVSASDGSDVASWPRSLDAERSAGVLAYTWMSDEDLFIGWGELKFGEVGLNGGDAFITRFGTVKVAEGTGGPPTKWHWTTHLGTTWCIPYVSSRYNTAVFPIFDVAAPAEDDDIARAPFRLWTYSNGYLEKLTTDGRRYFYPEIAPGGENAAAIATPPLERGKEQEGYDKGDPNFIPAGGDLVLVDMTSGAVRTLVAGGCVHPFWIDAKRLGFVQMPEDLPGKCRIVILDITRNSRLDLTEALGERLARLPAPISARDSNGVVPTDNPLERARGASDRKVPTPSSVPMIAAIVAGILVVGVALCLWRRKSRRRT